MQAIEAGDVSATRLWIATAVVILLVIAVWKFIDFRMTPPPPPNQTSTLAAP